MGGGERSSAEARVEKNLNYAGERRRSRLPDVGVPLHVQVVEVVGALGAAEVGALQPLDDLRLHHPGDVGRQQGQQQTLLETRRWFQASGSSPADR